MSYRDPAAALRTRRETIVDRLAHARRAAADAWTHEAQIAGLEQDLAAIDALLADASLESEGPRSLLDDVRIASPCPANWDDMIGDDRVRFCRQCTKNVYNLSALPREEAEALLRAAERRQAELGEGICVRLYKRADGTVLTADCPDGIRRKKRRLALFGAVGGGLMAAGAAAAELFGAGATQGGMKLPPPDPAMGLRASMTTAMGAAPMPAPPLLPVPAPTEPRTSPQVFKSTGLLAVPGRKDPPHPTRLTGTPVFEKAPAEGSER